jgi:hypothetical protein
MQPKPRPERTPSATSSNNRHLHRRMRPLSSAPRSTLLVSNAAILTKISRCTGDVTVIFVLSSATSCELAGGIVAVLNVNISHG